MGPKFKGTLSTPANSPKGTLIFLYRLPRSNLLSSGAGQQRSLECPMPQEYLWETIRLKTLGFYRQMTSTK